MLKYLNPSYYLRSAQRGGYTIDQTILIVVIIAILITLVIVTIGWNLINRTSGTKAGSQFSQVSDAVGQFYSATRMWPHQAMTSGGTKTAYALLLAGVRTTVGSPVFATNLPATLSNYVSGFTVNGTTSLRNGYGGDVGLMNNTAATQMGTGTQQYVVIEFANVPFNEAQEAERAVDGEPTGTMAAAWGVGRFVYSTATCLGAATAAIPTITAPTSGSNFACYVGPSL